MSPGTRQVPSKASDTELVFLAADLGARLEAAGLILCCAESCTGGWIAKVLTDIAGSSGWFDRGFVTYSNQAKRDMLGVRAETLDRHGAVSDPVVREMAEGALHRSAASVSVAVTGVAGPGGGTAGKPVGTVWMAWAARGRATEARRFRFDGDREAVRRQSVEAALRGVVDVLGR